MSFVPQKSCSARSSILALMIALTFLIGSIMMVPSADADRTGLLLEEMNVENEIGRPYQGPLVQSPPHQTTPIYQGSVEAAEIIDIAMEAVREYLKKAYTEEITERMVLDEIVRVILENGADPYVSAFWSANPDPDPSAGLIVCSGNDSSIPHGNYDDDDYKVIMPGEVVVVDIGARYQGRCSDETRTFFMGEPSEVQREIYGIVLEAHDLAAAEIEQFLQVRVLDKIARDHITENGYGDDFLHGLGHGVGYYIHELPMITQSTPLGDQPLKLWDVITIEPGIYITNETKGGGEIFGIRIEDDYGVTLDGYEQLTHFPTDIEEVIIRPDENNTDDGGYKDDGFFEGSPEGHIWIGTIFLALVPIAVILLSKKWEKNSEY